MSSAVGKLWDALVERHKKLTVAGEKGEHAIMQEVQGHQPLDPEVATLIRAVQITARLFYVQYPEANALQRAAPLEADDLPTE